MKTLRITITIGCILLSVVCVAQRRQIGDARTILKSGKNLDKAEKLMTDLLKDSANLENPRIYDVWLEAVEKQYGQLNEQMYKKEVVDTAKLFNLTKRMFTIAERLDSLDMLPDKKGKVDLQYRKANSEKLMTYRPNLFFGGAYYVRKSDFDKAFDLFETYIDCSQQPLFEAQDLMNTDARMGEAAYWASYSGYRMNDPVKTLRYLELARRDTAKLESTLLYAAEAWRMLKDETQYQAMLWEGFRLNPHSSYFFPRLIDSYTARGNYEQGLAVANEALKSDSLNQLFLFAKSTMQLNLGQYAECLKTSEQLINMNCEMADAYYNAGTACLNIVLKMDSRMHKKQIKRMYQRALPYMEAYRRLAPQEKDRWAPALYRIYFNLNMGKQFDEIDKLLQNR
jgi:hypothetical protein